MKKPLTSKTGRPLTLSSCVLTAGRTIWLFVLMLFLLPTHGFAQTDARMTINERNITLEQFINIVQRESNFSFFYKDSEKDGDLQLFI